MVCSCFHIENVNIDAVLIDANVWINCMCIGNAIQYNKAYVIIENIADIIIISICSK